MNAGPFLAFLLCACSAAACTTGKLSVGTNDAAGGLGACQATCSTPAGPVQDTTSLEQAYAQVQGDWLFCSGKDRFAGAPADAIGVEFAPVSSAIASCPAGGGCGEGQFYYLVQGPNGIIPGTGFAYQLTYDISDEVSYFQLNIHSAPNGGFGGSFRYSPCPKELELPGFNYATTPPVLIATDGSGMPDDAGAQPVSDSGATGDGAACPPAGPEQPVTAVAAAETDVAGRWQVCTGLDVLRKYAGANDIVGMEFGPASAGGGYCASNDTSCAGGDLYYLVPGSNGPARGQGFPYQAKYELTGTGNGLELDLSPAPNGGWTSSILYSPSPRELDITQLDYQNGPTMVAIP